MTCLCEHGTEGSTPSPQGCGVYQWTGLSVSPRSISILPLVNHFFFSGSAQDKKKICEEITTVAFLFASVAGEEQLHPLQCIMFTKHLTQRLECAEEFKKKWVKGYTAQLVTVISVNFQLQLKEISCF